MFSALQLPAIISEFSNVLLEHSWAHSRIASPHYYLTLFEYFVTSFVLLCSTGLLSAVIIIHSLNS